MNKHKILGKIGYTIFKVISFSLKKQDIHQRSLIIMISTLLFFGIEKFFFLQIQLE